MKSSQEEYKDYKRQFRIAWKTPSSEGQKQEFERAFHLFNSLSDGMRDIVRGKNRSHQSGMDRGNTGEITMRAGRLRREVKRKFESQEITETERHRKMKLHDAIFDSIRARNPLFDPG